MLATTHVLVGGLLGTTTTHPAAALGAGIASHLLLDSVPHWGGVTPRTWTAVAVVDGLTALSAAGILLARTPRDNRTAVLAGILGASIPDANKPIRLLLRKEVFPPALRTALARIQTEAPRYLTSDIAVGLIAIAALGRTLSGPT